MAHSKAQAARRYSRSGSEVVLGNNSSSLLENIMSAIYFSPWTMICLVTLHDIYNTYY